MFLACTRYRDTRARIIVIQAFARMVVCRTAYNVRLGAIVQAQRFSRYTVRVCELTPPTHTHTFDERQ